MISYAHSRALLLFFLTLSHAVMIKQGNCNCYDIGSVSSGKARKLGSPPQLPGYTQVTVPLLNSLSLANHDMRKTWSSVAGVYGTMTRSC